jgi:hypothetical protein
MFPVLAITGERPDTMLTCWGLLMLAVGLAMARSTATGIPRAARRSTPPPQTA